MAVGEWESGEFLGVPDGLKQGEAVELLLQQLLLAHEEIARLSKQFEAHEDRLLEELQRIDASSNELQFRTVKSSKIDRLKSIVPRFRAGELSIVEAARVAAWVILKAPSEIQVPVETKDTAGYNVSATPARSALLGDSPIREAIRRGDLDQAYLWGRALFPKHSTNKNFIQLLEVVAARRGNISQSVALANLKLDRKWANAPAVRVAEGRLKELVEFPTISRNFVPKSERVNGRVLHFVKESVPYRSNGFCARSFSNLVAELEAGYEAEVVTEPGFPGAADFNGANPEVVGGIPHYRLLPNGQSSASKLPADQFNQLFADLAMRIVLDRKPAVLHASSGRRGFETCKAALAVAEATGIPLVYEIRSFFEGTWTSEIDRESDSEVYRKRLDAERVCAQKADHVVTISETMRTEIMSWGIPGEKVSVIPNGVDTDRFFPAPKNTDLVAEYGLGGSLVIGYVSNLDHARESQETLIYATRDLVNDGLDVKCLLVGGGPRLDELKTLTENLGLQDSVVFTGPVEHSQIVDYYRLIDIFVVPRRDERAARLVTPLKPFEAMACGIPVVVSDLPALVEIAAPPERGLMFAERSPSELAGVIRGLIDDPASLRRLGEAGREWVVSRRQWHHNAEKYDAVYKSLEEKTIAE